MVKIKPEYIFPLLLILLDVGAAMMIRFSTHLTEMKNRNRNLK